AAVTAASTAFPPRFNASIAACVASVSTLAAAPPVPVEVGGPVGATAAAATPISTRNEERSAAATRNLPILFPLSTCKRGTYTTYADDRAHAVIGGAPRPTASRRSCRRRTRKPRITRCQVGPRAHGTRRLV